MNRVTATTMYIPAGLADLIPDQIQPVQEFDISKEWRLILAEVGQGNLDVLDLRIMDAIMQGKTTLRGISETTKANKGTVAKRIKAMRRLFKKQRCN